MTTTDTLEVQQLVQTDDDAQLVYEVEDALHEAMQKHGGQRIDWYGTVMRMPKFTGFFKIKTANIWINEVLNHPRSLALWPDLLPIRISRRYQPLIRYAQYQYTDQIKLPRIRRTWHLSVMVLLHELAHHIVFTLNGPYIEVHGPEFRATNLRLIEIVHSQDAADILRRMYVDAELAIGEIPIQRVAIE
jgi:putative metallohydrolase (TIGR04338 family)